MDALILYGDTERSSSMRHEVAIAIGDPFLLVQDSCRTWIMSSRLERDRLAACRPDAELVEVEDLGFYDLLDSGMSFDELWVELSSRMLARTGVRAATVEFEFPLGLAERLRADGVSLTVDDQAVKARRRRKSDDELAGIRRAQRAAQAAMAAARAVLAATRVTGDRLELDGESLTAEHVRERMREVCWEHGAVLGSEAIVSSVWQGFGHEPGKGRCRRDCRSRSTCGRLTSSRGAGRT